MRLLVLLAAVVVASGVLAQERQLQVAPVKPAPAGERRIALVIGNSAYKSAPLKNPVNDARAISKALSETGFRVTVLEDATQASMWRAIRNFGNAIQTGGGVGLFYYAGHGMQVRGKNYLIPVNADIEQEDEIEYQAVDANLVLSKMDTAKGTTNLMILDACRNNPFARSFRSAGQGLAQMDAPSGTLIAFATAPGSVAADGEGANGLYTKHLLANLHRPGLPIEHLFKEVRNGVGRETRDRQIPWESSSLRGDFFFVAPDASAASAAQRLQIDQAVAQAVRQEQEKLATLQRQMDEMVKQMLAKQREEMQAPFKSQPIPAGSATAQVASLAPSAAIGLGVDNTAFPRVGDTWHYVYTDTYTRVQRNLRYEVAAVSPEGILENRGIDGVVPAVRAYSAAPEIVYDQFWNFAPYLLSFGAPKAGERWRTLSAIAPGHPCMQAAYSCRYEGRVIGTEKVAVKAGTFDALKIAVQVILSYSGGWPSTTELTYWYAPAAKRMVKIRSRTLGPSKQADYDVELTSYKLN
jgi:hypothetical protein